MNQKLQPNIISIIRLLLLIAIIPLYIYELYIPALIIYIIESILDIYSIFFMKENNIFNKLSIRFSLYSILLIIVFSYRRFLTILILEIIIDIIKIIYKNNNIHKHPSLLEETKNIFINITIALFIVGIYFKTFYIVSIVLESINLFAHFLHYLYARHILENHLIGFKIFKSILTPIFNHYYHPKVLHKEYIPVEGPVILAGNHRHLFDQCLSIPATKRMVHYMAKKEYFDSIKTRWFFEMAGCISVNRSIKDEIAKEEALDILRHNQVLGIFPEGTRNKTDAVMLPFKFGTVSMAEKTGATIVPFAIRGKYIKYKNNLVIEFGKPFKVKGDLKIANEKLEKAVKDLYLKEDKKNV